MRRVREIPAPPDRGGKGRARRGRQGRHDQSHHRAGEPAHLPCGRASRADRAREVADVRPALPAAEECGCTRFCGPCGRLARHGGQCEHLRRERRTLGPGAGSGPWNVVAVRTKHTFRLPRDLASKLADYAARKRVSQPLVVEAALASHLSSRKAFASSSVLNPNRGFSMVGLGIGRPHHFRALPQPTLHPS